MDELSLFRSLHLTPDVVQAAAPDLQGFRAARQAAARLGLSRGVLAPGASADITVFDPGRFAERGTTFEPNRLADGVVHVLVNGVHTLRDGALTGERGGQVLRR